MEVGEHVRVSCFAINYEFETMEMSRSMQQFDMSENQIKWVIFSVAVIFFPTAYFLILDFAIWPVLLVCVDKIVDLALDGSSEWGLLLLVQSVFWTILLYFISIFISKMINTLEGTKRYVVLGGVVCILVTIGMSPSYDEYVITDKVKRSAFYLYKLSFEK